MTEILKRTASILDEPMIYCPGCSHGIIHRLTAEVIDEMGLADKTIGVSSIGCSVRIWNFLKYDFVQGAHGRGMAVATGITVVLPMVRQVQRRMPLRTRVRSFHYALRLCRP